MKAKPIGIRLDGSKLTIEIELERVPEQGINDLELDAAIREIFHAKPVEVSAQPPARAPQTVVEKLVKASFKVDGRCVCEGF